MAPIGSGLDAVGSMVNNAVDTARGAVDDVVETKQDALGSFTDTGQDVFESVTDGVGGVFDGVDFDGDTLKDVASALFEGGKGILSGQNSVGGAVGGAVDAVGLPDWASDFTAMTVDFATMNAIGGTDHAVSLAGGIAESAGADGVADFLDVAGNVTGMFNDVSMTIGAEAIKAKFTGGMGGVDGVLGQLGQAGNLGQVGDIVGQAGELGGHLDSAIDVVDAFGGDNLLDAGTGLFDMLGGNMGGVGDLLGDAIDPAAVDALQGVLGDGGDLLGEIFGEFGGVGGLADLPIEEVLDGVGLQPGDLDGLAGAIAGLGGEMVNVGDEAVALGSELFDTEAGRELIAGLVAIAEAQGTAHIEGVDAAMEAAIEEAFATTAGFVDMASHDAEVAAEALTLLAQIGSLSSSTSVSQMIGAQVRA